MQRPILAIVRERNVALHCADAWCNEIIAGVQGEVRGKTAKKKFGSHARQQLLDEARRGLRRGPVRTGKKVTHSRWLVVLRSFGAVAGGCGAARDW